jgi:hypothetical protein
MHSLAATRQVQIFRTCCCNVHRSHYKLPSSCTYCCSTASTCSFMPSTIFLHLSCGSNNPLSGTSEHCSLLQPLLHRTPMHGCCPSSMEAYGRACQGRPAKAGRNTNCCTAQHSTAWLFVAASTPMAAQRPALHDVLINLAGFPKHYHSPGRGQPQLVLYTVRGEGAHLSWACLLCSDVLLRLHCRRELLNLYLPLDLNSGSRSRSQPAVVAGGWSGWSRWHCAGYQFVVLWWLQVLHGWAEDSHWMCWAVWFLLSYAKRMQSWHQTAGVFSAGRA